MNKLFRQATLASLLAMTMSSAMAVSTSAVTGQWSLTLYTGPNLKPSVKQGICFQIGRKLVFNIFPRLEWRLAAEG